MKTDGPVEEYGAKIEAYLGVTHDCPQ
jgi:hypothetical protein